MNTDEQAVTPPSPGPGRRINLRLAAALAALSGSLVIADQWTKAWIVDTIPLNTIGPRLLDDFLWIVHTRNLGIAFSIGDDISRLLRIGLFIILPAIFIVIASVYCVVSAALTTFQKFAVATIIGGGLGNLIDRIFRPEGVVDFLSFSLFGIFGWDRFPTFNIADSSVTVGACLLILSGFLWEKEHTDVARP